MRVCCNCELIKQFHEVEFISNKSLGMLPIAQVAQSSLGSRSKSSGSLASQLGLDTPSPAGASKRPASADFRFALHASI